MILFAYCTCVLPSLLLSVPHELYSASSRFHRSHGAGGMTARFRAPSVPAPLPIPMEMLYFLYLRKNWELSGVPQQCCLLKHQIYSIHDKWGALWLCRTSLKLTADDAVALLTQTIRPSAMQRWVGKLRAGVDTPLMVVLWLWVWSRAPSYKAVLHSWLFIHHKFLL